MTRVLVADDQTVVREGLVLLLGLIPGLEVVGAAVDGADAVRLVGEHRPDIVLMDLRMPRMDGVEATRVVRERHPDTQVVVLTTYADDESVFAALKAGARGFLTKSAGADEIAEAIARVRAGDAQLDPSVQRRLLDSMTSPKETPSRPGGLTAREIDVLRLIAGGLSNAEIAKRLFISETTVKTHINNLFAKIGARDRAQAVTYAYRNGLAD
ncbi:response regulator transcription factor [Streptosporangiaceae bacterium NEAU-GS5]|nr:response regulator transcription factor [Streptosporangiaceae bacterium NEAU-GS5]